MPFLKGLYCLAKLTFKRCWFWILWSGICLETFRGEYLHYKLAPQFHYLRKMLGCGICISRGSAAVLNVSSLAIVLTSCRNLYSLISLYLPTAIYKKLDSIAVSSKSNHLAVAGTIVLTSLLHTLSHIANAINSSRNFVVEFPAANLATFRGESPSILIFTTGITGILMMTILILLCVTSLRFVRRRNYERFYYTHHCGLLYLVLIVMHPISGVIKAISNVDSHHPSCSFMKESDLQKKEFLEEEAEFSNFTNKHLYITKVDVPKVDFTLPALPAYHKHQIDIENKGVFENEKNAAELIKVFNSKDDVNLANHQSINLGHFEKPSLPIDTEMLFEQTNINRNNIGEHRAMTPFWAASTDNIIKSSESVAEVSSCGELDKLFHGKPQLQNNKEISFMASKKNNEMHRNIPHQRIQDVFENKFDKQYNQQTHSKDQSCHLPPTFTPVQSKAWMWICSALLLWLLEFSVGFIRGRGEVKLLQVVHYPNCDLAELSFSKKDFACYPGQFVLLRCPQISMFQWHPFTIARCPADNGGVLTVVMKTKGNWCTNVIEHLQKNLLTSLPDATSKCRNNRDVECQQYCMPKSATYSPSNVNHDYEIYKQNHSLLTISPRINYEMEVNNVSRMHENGKLNKHLRSLGVAQEKRPASIHKSKSLLVNAHQNISQLNENTFADRFNTFKNVNESQKSINVVRPNSECECNSLNNHEECEDSSDTACKLSHCKIVYDINEQLIEDYCGRFYMNGPFNSVNEKLFSYNVVIGIAGGVGITPFVASLTHIIQANENSPTRIHIVWMLRNLQLVSPIVSLFQSLADKFWNNQQEDRMEVRLHCTSKTVTNETIVRFKKCYPYLGARLYRGRPDWKNLFEVWTDSYKRSRVGVFCSGPKPLNRKINEHILVAASKGINFSYHHESFS